jgi:HAD superfamily hydrolase (TIGR01509 family)
MHNNGKDLTESMHWIHNYQLFLFDFDGLLVNTEEIHYLAYKQMCAARGIDLQWSFHRYCQAAHYDAHALREQLYAEFPILKQQEPNWSVLYAEKKAALQKLVKEGSVDLMPGVQEFLSLLEKHAIPRCVVTHSPDSLVQLIRKKHPVLNTIPLWITREHYSQPKPHSECYLYAIASFAKPQDRIIGFEDTPRGIHALMGTRAEPVLICQADYPEISEFLTQGVRHYSSFRDIMNP